MLILTQNWTIQCDTPSRIKIHLLHCFTAVIDGLLQLNCISSLTCIVNEKYVDLWKAGQIISLLFCVTQFLILMQNAFNISLIPPILTFAPSFPDVKNSQETICIEKLLQISALFMLSQIYNGLQAVKSIKNKRSKVRLNRQFHVCVFLWNSNV